MFQPAYVHRRCRQHLHAVTAWHVTNKAIVRQYIGKQ